jgi:hypothetical protein
MESSNKQRDVKDMVRHLVHSQGDLALQAGPP